MTMSHSCREGAHGDCTADTCVCMHHMRDRVVTALDVVRRDSVWRYALPPVPGAAFGAEPAPAPRSGS